MGGWLSRVCAWCSFGTRVLANKFKVVVFCAIVVLQLKLVICSEDEFKNSK